MLQEYLINFVIRGNLNGRGLQKWPEYRQQAAVVDFMVDRMENIVSNVANSWCAFWNRVDYYPKVSSG